MKKQEEQTASGRRLPNLKNLRQMIQNSSIQTANSSANLINQNEQKMTHVASSKFNKNESECSFNLTDDEERIGERSTSLSRQTQKRNSILKNRSESQNQKILVLETVTEGKSDVKQEQAEEDEQDDDLFLKELEQENKCLEEELKNLQ